MICTAITKRGRRCVWKADATSGLCLNHDPARAEVRGRLAATRGRAGKAAQLRAVEAARAAGRRQSCRLRSTDDLLTELERAVLMLDGSGGDAATRAKAIAAVVAEARAVLKVGDLEAENAELKKLLVERHPELRKHLKVA